MTKKNWISVITKSRAMDSNFRTQIENNHVYMCEKHFQANYIKTCKYKPPPLSLTTLWRVSKDISSCFLK